VDQLVSEATARVGEMDKLSSEVSQSQVTPLYIYSCDFVN
jgi:L-lysine 2,3-aminomutase